MNTIKTWQERLPKDKVATGKERAYARDAEIADLRGLLAAKEQPSAPSELHDIFDMIREWAALPEGQRGDIARQIIGRMNDSYMAGVKDGRATAATLAAKEQREVVAWPEPVAFGPYSGLYSKEQVQQCIEAARTEMISAAVNRFLCWQLPKDFNPDCGISFDGRKDDEFNKNKTWPVGTNLMHAGQVKAMFEHCLILATPPAAPVADGGDAVGWQKTPTNEGKYWYAESSDFPPSILTIEISEDGVPRIAKENAQLGFGFVGKKLFGIEGHSGLWKKIDIPAFPREKMNRPFSCTKARPNSCFSACSEFCGNNATCFEGTAIAASGVKP